MAAVTVKSVNGGNITLDSEPSFQTQVAVLKITMQDALTNKLNATSLKIKIGDKDLCTLSPSTTAYTGNGDGVVYFALPSAHRVYADATSSIGLDEEELAVATVTFTATAGGNTYIATKTGYLFAAGKYYATTLTMAEPEVAGEYFTSKSDGTKVVFSKGNLQATYNGSTWTWAFAAHQYDYIGNAEGNTKVSKASPYVSGYSGTSTTVDLFGWVGASTTMTDDAAIHGINFTGSSTDVYGSSATEALKSDWGELTITNGGTYTWRTPTGGSGGEWEWIIGPYSGATPGTNCRASGATVNGVANARYTQATINTDGTPVNGIILFPDGCKINSSSATTWGAINNSSAYATKCTEAQWTHLEELGCVFLPAAGYRNGAAVPDAGTDGLYWSSSPNASNAEQAHNVWFGSGIVVPAYSYDRYYGRSVRLVREVPSN